MQITPIGPNDHALHAPYCDYVSRVFSSADFRRWITWGEWREGYRAHAVVEHGVVLANASTMRMQLVVDGGELEAFQLGAVGCLPEHRGRGLARLALQAALAHCGAAPVLLFANPRVLEFYGRFGFVARDQHVFGAELAIAPTGKPAVERLDPDDPHVRDELRALCARALPSSTRFGARDYGEVLAWFLANGFSRPLHRLAPDLVVVAGCDGDTLHLDDVFCPRPVALEPLLPRLVDRPVARVHLGFAPDAFQFPAARVIAPDPDAHLFVRGFARLPGGPDRFPIMAHT